MLRAEAGLVLEHARSAGSLRHHMLAGTGLLLAASPADRLAGWMVGPPPAGSRHHTTSHDITASPSASGLDQLIHTAPFSLPLPVPIDLRSLGATGDWGGEGVLVTGTSSAGRDENLRYGRVRCHSRVRQAGQGWAELARSRRVSHDRL